MSIGTFVIGASVIFWAVVFAVIVGAIIYLKRRGVLRQAADAAKAAVDKDVQDAADKLTGK